MIQSSRSETRGRLSRSCSIAVCIILPILTVLVASGCGTGGLAVKRDVWEAQDTFERRQAGLSEKLLSMEGRLNAIEEDLGALRYRLDEFSQEAGTLKSEFARGLEAIRDGQQELGIELEKKIRTQGSERTKDREDLQARMEIILDEVTRENQALRDELANIKSAVATGYTHEVKRGETLAQIAAKYGVSVTDVAAANEITNPNRIAVGQKLFIPEGQ